MTSKLYKKAELRLKKVLLDDKLRLPNGFYALLQSDVEKILKSYFDYLPQQLSLNIDVDDKGQYLLQIRLVSDRVLPVNILATPDQYGKN